MRLLPARDIGALHDFPAADAGVVDEHVDFLDDAMQRAEAVRDAAFVRHVHHDRRGVRALRLDVGGSLLAAATRFER